MAHRRRNDGNLVNFSKQTKVVLELGLERKSCIAELKYGILTFFEEDSSVLKRVCAIKVGKGQRIEEREDGKMEMDLIPINASDISNNIMSKIVVFAFVNAEEKAEWKAEIKSMIDDRKKHEEGSAGTEEEKEKEEEKEGHMDALLEKHDVVVEEIETESFSSKKANIPFESIKNSSVRVCSADFLNKLLWRYFQEIATSYVFEEKLGERIEIQLKKQLNKAKEMGKWPAILKGLKFHRIIKGNGFITAHKVKVDKCFADGSLMAQVDAEYQGGAGVSIGTTAVLAPFGSTLGVCDIEIVVTLLHIRTLLYVFMPRNFKEKFSLCFEKFPDLENVKFGVEVYVGRRKVPLVNHFSVVKTFAESLVMMLMCRSLVYPSRLRFFLPYPGRKNQAKIQRFLPPAEMKKRALKKGKTTGGEAKSTFDGVTLKPTVKQLRDSRKNAQRKKSALEFFERILKMQMTATLCTLCDEEIEVFGFSDIDLHIVGQQSLMIALTDLRRRFQDLTFSVSEECVVEEGVLITWAMKGVQIAKVWSKYPNDPPEAIEYNGTAMFSFDSFGKIVALEFFWNL